MRKILIAGATGYLGHFIVDAAKDANYYTKVIVRDVEKFKKQNLHVDEIIQAELTKPETLKNICNDVDVVISAVGITRQHDGLTYEDVDFQANFNLLSEAVKSGVEKFLYVSVLNGEKFKNLKICAAKEKFVNALRNSGLTYTIIRPNGFFSDMAEYFEMAQKGRIFLFGKGDNKINPISGEDLANFCVTAINNDSGELSIGGPETYTHNQIARLAFSVTGKQPKIMHIPMWLTKFILGMMRRFTSSKIYGPFEFLITILSHDMIAPSFGTYQLKDYFQTLQVKVIHNN